MCRQDLPALFAPAAWTMFDGISAATTITPRQAIVVQVSGLDLPELLVRCLSELLDLYETQRFMCCACTLTTLEPTALTATLQGEPFDATLPPIATAIKAVTYHQIAVEHTGECWQARVIFAL